MKKANCKGIPDRTLHSSKQHKFVYFRTKWHKASIKIYSTEEVQPYDPRNKQFSKGTMKNLNGLIVYKTWEVVKERDVSFDANVLGRRFVLAIKSKGCNNEV